MAPAGTQRLVEATCRPRTRRPVRVPAGRRRRLRRPAFAPAARRSGRPEPLYDQAAFRWTDAGWRGAPLRGAVLYELHVGTFTPEGTFDAAIERLDHLPRSASTTSS